VAGSGVGADGSLLFELRKKCATAETFPFEFGLKLSLADRDVDLYGEQETTGTKALGFFSRRLQESSE